MYQSSELGDLRKRLSRPKVTYPRVEIQAPPGNLGYIYVLDPDKREYLRVPAENQMYAAGLSLRAHRIHLTYCHKYLSSRTDTSALAEAQAQIWEWCLTVAKGNKEIARYLEDHSRPHPTGPLVSHEMVRKMVDKLAGKRMELPPPEEPANRELSKKFKDCADDQLPRFDSSRDLPALSSSAIYQSTEKTSNVSEWRDGNARRRKRTVGEW